MWSYWFCGSEQCVNIRCYPVLLLQGPFTKHFLNRSEMPPNPFLPESQALGSFLCAFHPIDYHLTSHRPPNSIFFVWPTWKPSLPQLKQNLNSARKNLVAIPLRTRRVWSLKENSLISVHRNEKKYLLVILQEDTSFSDGLSHLFQSSTNNNRFSILKQVGLFIYDYICTVYVTSPSR